MIIDPDMPVEGYYQQLGVTYETEEELIDMVSDFLSRNWGVFAYSFANSSGQTTRRGKPQSPGVAARKPFTSSQCMKASNQRLLVRSGFPRPKPWPPFW